MGREAVDLLKKQYRELYGRSARGAHSNSVAWLQSKINEKLKDRVGPQGPRGPIGKTGAKGAKGGKGAKGNEGAPGEDGAAAIVFVEKAIYALDENDYFSLNKIVSPAQRLPPKIQMLQYRSDLFQKLHQSHSLLKEGGKVNYELKGIGKQIFMADADYQAKKEAVNLVHSQLKSLATSPLAQQFISVHFKMQDTISQREAIKVMLMQQQLMKDVDYPKVAQQLTGLLEDRKEKKKLAIEAQEELRKKRITKVRMKSVFKDMMVKAQRLEDEVDDAMISEQSNETFAESQELFDSQEFADSQVRCCCCSCSCVLYLSDLMWCVCAGR
eukprot:SAG11_NODE_4703_length_1797_cov_8.928151_2_plen_327_part_00